MSRFSSPIESLGVLSELTWLCRSHEISNGKLPCTVGVDRLDTPSSSYNDRDVAVLVLTAGSAIERPLNTYE